MTSVTIIPRNRVPPGARGRDQAVQASRLRSPGQLCELQPHGCRAISRHAACQSQRRYSPCAPSCFLASPYGRSIRRPLPGWVSPHGNATQTGCCEKSSPALAEQRHFASMQWRSSCFSRKLKPPGWPRSGGQIVKSALLIARDETALLLSIPPWDYAALAGFWHGVQVGRVSDGRVGRGRSLETIFEFAASDDPLVCPAAFHVLKFNVETRSRGPVGGSTGRIQKAMTKP